MSGGGKRVLVVEDNADNRRLVELLLTALGHTPLLAASGPEGVQKVGEAHPDLVLMDLHMPGMDGREAAAMIRRDPVCGHTPLVAVTAYAMAGDRDQILNAGFDGYISKPITPELFGQQLGCFLAGEGYHR